MPPKKAKKKGKKGKANTDDDDGGKDKLWDHLIALREELEQTKKQKNYFQHERDNVMCFWDKAKRSLEQQQALNRERLRAKEDREKDLQDEIKQVLAKLQHVQFEHNNAISELKIEALVSLGQIANAFTEKELALHRKKVAQHTALFEKKSNLDKCIKALMIKQNEEIIEMRYEYDHILKQINRYHMRKFQEVIQEHAKLLEEKMIENLEDITAKIGIREQDIQRQWHSLIEKANTLNKENGLSVNLYESDESP